MSGLKLIACVDENMGIGRDGGLLFDLPMERKMFARLTRGGTVIMGRRTWESLPKKPLEGRLNIIVSSDEFTYGAQTEPWQYNGAILRNCIEAALDTADYPDGSNSIWVIGGGQIYRQMLPMCDEAYITHVEADGHADTFLEDWNPDEWDRVARVAAQSTRGVPRWHMEWYKRREE